MIEPAIQTTMNLIDAQADRLIELSMISNDSEQAKVIREYAENLMALSTNTYVRLKRRRQQAA